MTALPKLKQRFPEPVVESGADPYVVIHGDYFYYCHVINDQAIYIRKAKTLDAIGHAKEVRVWPAENEPLGESMWAPELHFLDGKWYIYFANGVIDPTFSQQRMYVLEGQGEDPQSAVYSLKGKIADSTDQWGIDGTILTLPDSKRYYIWSGWESNSNTTQNLYIAEMKNPWTIIGERVKIASPIYQWELNGPVSINEGPQVLSRSNQRSLIYSASHSLTNYYCLGQIMLVGDNPLDPTHWAKSPNPIYESHKKLIAPGHASFIVAPDESYGWMIFHTARYKDAGWDRQVRLAAFRFNLDGTLRFLPTTNLFDEIKQQIPPVKFFKKIQKTA